MNSSARSRWRHQQRQGLRSRLLRHLPYYDDVIAEPKNSIIGGATLWTLNGKDPEVYKGVAQFFTYLSQPEVQADWHQATGYLPITNAAYELGKEQKTTPTRTRVRTSPSSRSPAARRTANSKGVRFGNLTQIRDVVDQAVRVRAFRRQDAAAGPGRPQSSAATRSCANSRLPTSSPRSSPLHPPFEDGAAAAPRQATALLRRGVAKIGRSMQTKRTVFPSKFLPYFLLLPQLAVTLHLLHLARGAGGLAVLFEREDPFGFKTTFVWFENYQPALRRSALSQLASARRRSSPSASRCCPCRCR